MATFNARRALENLTVASEYDYHAPAANTAAVITYPAVYGQSHAITDGIVYSYSSTGSLTGGNLLVTVAGVTVFSMDIIAKGPGFVPFHKAGGNYEAMVITLAAGGADVIGKVNVAGYMRIDGSAIGAGGIFDFEDYAASGLIAVI